MKHLSLFMLVLLACVYGQQPVPCVTPPQFHSRIAQYDHGNDIIRRFMFQYDQINLRTSFLEEIIEVFPGRKFYRYITFYALNVAYQIDMKTEECTKVDVPKFRPIGVPPNATFESDYNIGGPTDYVTTQDWSDRIPNQKMAEVYASFTVKDCFPVRWTTVTNQNTNSSVTTNFFDNVQGIPDPNVFIVPPQCFKAKYARVKYIPSFFF